MVIFCFAVVSAEEECPSVKTLCRVFCEYGFKKDARGCDMPCICDDAPVEDKVVESTQENFTLSRKKF